MVSEKTKRTIAGVVGIAGLIIIMVAVLLFFWPLLASFWASGELLTTDESQFFFFAVVGGVGIAMAVWGFGAVIGSAKKRMKEGIADFANPILKSKGKVSLRQIAAHSKWDIENALRRNALEIMIKDMIGVGYFEGARFEGGWLIKDVAPCPYCSEPVRLTDKKCPNCGAVIQK